MKRVAHISDPHFGAHDRTLERALLADLAGETAPPPTVVAVSGDLTQRARASQFMQARRFLGQIAAPVIVVPGNHDIPLFDVFRRVFRSRTRFCRYITRDLSPAWWDDTLVVVGVDTAKRFTIKGGEVRPAQVERVCAQLAPHPGSWKIVVAHHPFVIPAGVADGEDLVEGAAMATPRFEAVGVDLILSGHLHLPYSDDVAGRNPAHTIIAVHAGSCLSTRLRGEPNGYNMLCFDGPHCTITPRLWDGTRFVDGDSKTYTRGGGRERIVRDAPALWTTPSPHA